MHLKEYRLQGSDISRAFGPWCCFWHHWTFHSSEDLATGFWSRWIYFKLDRLISLWLQTKLNNIYLLLMWLRKTLIWTVESPRVVVWGLLYLLSTSPTSLTFFLNTSLPSMGMLTTLRLTSLSDLPLSIRILTLSVWVRSTLLTFVTGSLRIVLMINDAKTVFLITFAIYTKDKLKTANVISDDFCHQCKSEQHTIQHMWHDSHGSTRLVISKVDLSPEVDSHK